MDIPYYRHEPLTVAHEIRVFKISVERARVQLHILHVTISSSNYQALSYAWGEADEANRATVLDSHDNPVGWIPLTKNLDNALHDLQDTEGLQHNAFWVDQICINQEDEHEKSSQVAMMSQIYSHATQVITYLGPAESEEQDMKGIRLLHRIHGTISENTWSFFHKAGSIERIESLIEEGSLQLERLPSDIEWCSNVSRSLDDASRRSLEQDWKWLIRVAYGEWTQRLWMVQEQLLNQTLVALRGQRVIDWDMIATIPLLFAIRYLPRHYVHANRQGRDHNFLASHRIERTLYGTWWERHTSLKARPGHSRSSLLYNLLWYWPLFCGDPRDRVYAILAISKDSKLLGIEPDYSAVNTAEKLSKDMSVCVLQHARDLKLLSAASAWRQPASTLPTWCLPLNMPHSFRTPQMTTVGVYKPHPWRRLHQPTRFSACNSTLILRGQKLDEILSSPSDLVYSCCGTLIEPQFVFLASLASLPTADCSLENVQSLLRTVTAWAPWVPPFTAHISPAAYTAFHLWAYLRYRLRRVSRSSVLAPSVGQEEHNCLSGVTESLQALCERLAAYIPSSLCDLVDQEGRAVDRVLQHVLEKGRKLGCTREGRFYNARQGTSAGDAIVALQGADQLFVLRLTGTTYKLIGDIFVDGLMNGEAYKNKDPQEVDYDIELS